MVRPITKKHNLDHWGFYQVGEIKTYSKIEAIEISGKVKKPIKFNFNNEIFDSFDWTKEPEGDLKFWYRARAEQIRNEYDYIVLLYSGGADSHNILQTFIENNIFIDEIAQFVCLEGTPNEKQEIVNWETYTVSAPRTQQLIQSNPLYRNTKHRIVDGGQYQIKSILEENTFDLWYQRNNWNFSPYVKTFGGIKHYVPEYKRLMDQGKKVCLLWGWDKLRMSLDSNLNCNVEFIDSGMSSSVPPFERRDNDPNLPKDESFYWNPDLPELIIKQAHQVKKFLSHALQYPPDNINIKYSGVEKSRQGLRQLDRGQSPLKFIFNDQRLEITNQAYHKIIYPYYQPELVFDGGKPISSFFGGRDDWIWNSNVPEIQRMVKLYGSGVAWLKNMILKSDPSFWIEHPYDPKVDKRFCAGMKLSVNSYSIGKIQIAK